MEPRLRCEQCIARSAAPAAHDAAMAGRRRRRGARVHAFPARTSVYVAEARCQDAGVQPACAGWSPFSMLLYFSQAMPGIPK